MRREECRGVEGKCHVMSRSDLIRYEAAEESQTSYNVYI